MRLRIKANELINILIQKQEKNILKKYNLNYDKVKDIQKSLREGKWRIVS